MMRRMTSLKLSLYGYDDDYIPFVAPFVWGSGSQAPNIKRRRVFIRISFSMPFGASFTTQNTSRSPSRCQLDCFLQIMTTSSERRRMLRVRWDCRRSVVEKICSAVCQLTSGVSSAGHNAKNCIAASPSLVACKHFYHSVIEVYGNDALHHPNAFDIGRLLNEGNAPCFPQCICWTDCLHWEEGKNCPFGWKGMFKGMLDSPKVVLDAIADNHWCFGMISTLALQGRDLMISTPWTALPCLLFL